MVSILSVTSSLLWLLTATFKARTAVPHVTVSEYRAGICTYCNTAFTNCHFYVKFDFKLCILKRSRKRQMAGEIESSALSILCSTEYELARLAACQSNPPKGQDVEMTALSLSISVPFTALSFPLSLHHLRETHKLTFRRHLVSLSVELRKQKEKETVIL